MRHIIFIATGGAAGSLCRYWLSLGITYWLGNSFPYGTLTINVIGSFFMGLIAAILLGQTSHLIFDLRALLLTGFLGGFTTFSAFSLETLSLMEGKLFLALVNILLSVGLSIMAVWLGFIIGEHFAR